LSILFELFLVQCHGWHTRKEKFTLKFAKYKVTGDLGAKGGIIFEEILKKQVVKV
jgi:hypothetical protein